MEFLSGYFVSGVQAGIIYAAVLLYRYMNEADALASIIKSAGSSEMLTNLTIAQTPTSIKMTVSMIVVLPILMVYPYFQRFFIKGIMIGAVKG